MGGHDVRHAKKRVWADGVSTSVQPFVHKVGGVRTGSCHTGDDLWLKHVALSHQVTVISAMGEECAVGTKALAK